MTATSYATLSNQAVMFAAIIYALALLSHITEWSIRRTSPVLEAVPRRVLVGGEPDPVGTPPPNTPAPTNTQAHADTDTDTGAVDRFGRIGVALTTVAFVLHTTGVVTRGLAADRVPWGNMYEFAIAGSWGVAAIYLVLLRRFRLRWLGLPVTGFIVIVLMLAVLTLYVPPGPLVPALHSYWLVIHVTAAMLGAGAFTVGAMLSALLLFKQRAERRGGGSPNSYLARIPAADSIDRIAYRVHAFGFPVWTFAALIAGPIWAEYAWGRYWGWDPKEVWAFITWVIYAAYLHARATAGWRGKGAALLSLAGFASVIFNFVGINLFGSGLHSYAGF